MQTEEGQKNQRPVGGQTRTRGNCCTKQGNRHTCPSRYLQLPVLCGPRSMQDITHMAVCRLALSKNCRDIESTGHVHLGTVLVGLRA